MHTLMENLAFMFGAGLLVLPLFAHGIGNIFYPLLFVGFLFGVEVSKADLKVRWVYPFVLASYISGLALHLGISPFLVFPLLLLPLGKLRGNHVMVLMSLLLMVYALGLGLVSEPSFAPFNAAGIPLFLFVAYFAFFTDNVRGEAVNIRKVALALSFVIYTLFTVSTAGPQLPTLATELGSIFAVLLLTHSLVIVSCEDKSFPSFLGTLALLLIYQFLQLDFPFQVVLGGVVINLLAMAYAWKNRRWLLLVLTLVPLVAGALIA
jgi:hypothetical protein